MDELKVKPIGEANQRLLANVHPPDWKNPRPRNPYNLVVIGGGSAGLVAAAGAAGLGARVALIERGMLGGDCLNVGCVPSKTLIRSARAIAEIARAGQYGVRVEGKVAVDFPAVMERVREVRAEISPHDSAARYREMGVDLFFGEARFTGRDSVMVGEQILHFKKAVIATGSRPTVIPIEGLARAGYHTNETIFELREQPARLAIIGAGPIGAELAQAFQRLGTQVTLFDLLPQVLGREDQDAAEIVERALLQDGVRLMLGGKTTRVSVHDSAKVIHFEKDGEESAVEVDEILLAVGRTPNVELLGLEAAGVLYDKKGIEVGETLRTTNADIYASGDVAVPYQFTHMADATSRLVLQNALFPGPDKKWTDLVVPWVTYTDPEVAHVGMYPQDAQEKGIPHDSYHIPLPRTDRARTDGVEEGFVKVHTRRGGGKILGATIVAPHAGEMINEITLAMTQGLGLGAIAEVIHPYPTQAEAIRRAADSYNRSRFTPLLQKVASAWFRLLR